MSEHTDRTALESDLVARIVSALIDDVRIRQGLSAAYVKNHQLAREWRRIVAAAIAQEPSPERPAPTCATCRHWTQLTNANDLPLNIGRCEQGIRQGGADTGALYVAAKFGCILHEPQETR